MEGTDLGNFTEGFSFIMAKSFPSIFQNPLAFSGTPCRGIPGGFTGFQGVFNINFFFVDSPGKPKERGKRCAWVLFFVTRRNIF